MEEVVHYRSSVPWY